MHDCAQAIKEVSAIKAIRNGVYGGLGSCCVQMNGRER